MQWTNNAKLLRLDHPSYVHTADQTIRLDNVKIDLDTRPTSRSERSGVRSKCRKMTATLEMGHRLADNSKMPPTRVLAAALCAAVALSACAHGRKPEASPRSADAYRGSRHYHAARTGRRENRPSALPSGRADHGVRRHPAFGDLDTKAHRGLAMEYEAQRRAYVLSEWPRQSFRITFLKADITSTPCTLAHYSRNGVAWTSRRSLLLTLQPDGRVSPSAVEAEAHRLLGAGGCS